MKMGKLFLSALLGILMCLSMAIVAGCAKNAPTLKEVTITNETALLGEWYVGDEDRKVEVALAPDNFSATNATITVTSANTEVIEVNDDGVTLHAKFAGKSVITVKATATDEKQGSAETTLELTVSVPTLSINKQSATLVPNEELQLSATTKPAGTVTWTSLNTDVATVDETGKVKAVATGEATIKASCNGIDKTCTVKVASPELAVSCEVPDKLYIGETLPITAVVKLDGVAVTDAVITATCEDTAVTVENLTITAVAKGTVSVTVSCNYRGIALSKNIENITVKPVITDLTVNNQSALTAVWVVGDADRTVDVTVSPDDFANANITVISDSSAVTVNGKTLHAVEAGTATITVKASTDESKEGEITKTFSVSVVPELTGIEITNKTELRNRWIVDDTARAIALSYNPSDYYNDDNAQATITFSSEGVLTADNETRTLTPVGAGTVTVTVTVRNATDTVEITVLPKLSSITVSNESDFSDEWTLGETGTKKTAQIVYDSAENYNADNAPLTATVSGDEVVTATVNGATIEIEQLGGVIGTATVTISSIHGVSTTLSVTVVVTNPTLTMSSTAEIKALEGDVVDLPEITATACDGRDLISHITVTPVENLSVNGDNTQLTIGVVGTYTQYSLTFTVADPLDAEKTATQTITVNAYRKIFLQQAGQEKIWTSQVNVAQSNLYVADAAQTVQYLHEGGAYAQFNLTPSKLYYAEATYDLTNPAAEWGVFTGLGHFVAGDYDRWLVNAVQFKASEATLWSRDSDTKNGGWSIDNGGDQTPSFRNYVLDKAAGLDFQNYKHVKIATARIGDNFYTFINDVYVCTSSYDYYRANDTMPGIAGYDLCNTNPAYANKTSISNISFFDGEAARTKINSLITDEHNGRIAPYCKWTDEGGYIGSVDRTNYKLNAASEERGEFNFDFLKSDKGYYDGAVSPQVYFRGDFTFKFDYKATTVGASNAFMQFSLRPREHDNVLCSAGIFYDGTLGRDGDATRRPDKGAPNAEKKPTQLFTSTWTDMANAVGDGVGAYPVTVNGFDGIFDESQGVRFVITHKLNNVNATVKITIHSIAKPSQSMTQEYTLHQSGYQHGVVVMWNNYGVAGEYSNISWSYAAEDYQIPNAQ